MTRTHAVALALLISISNPLTFKGKSVNNKATNISRFTSMFFLALFASIVKK